MNMQFPMILVGIAMIFMGLWGLLTPRVLANWIRHVSMQGGYVIATGLRIGLALILWLAAPKSRFPEVMMVLAGLAGVAAVVLMLIGYRRYRLLIRFWAKLPPWSIRLQMILPIVFGVGLIWLMS